MPRAKSVPAARSASCTLTTSILDQNVVATLNETPLNEELVKNLEGKIEMKLHSFFGDKCGFLRANITLESAPSLKAMRSPSSDSMAIIDTGTMLKDYAPRLASQAKEDDSVSLASEWVEEDGTVGRSFDLNSEDGDGKSSEGRRHSPWPFSHKCLGWPSGENTGLLLTRGNPKKMPEDPLDTSCPLPLEGRKVGRTRRLTKMER